MYGRIKSRSSVPDDKDEDTQRPRSLHSGSYLFQGLVIQEFYYKFGEIKLSIPMTLPFCSSFSSCFINWVYIVISRSY